MESALEERTPNTFKPLAKPTSALCASTSSDSYINIDDFDAIEDSEPEIPPTPTARTRASRAGKLQLTPSKASKAKIETAAKPPITLKSTVLTTSDAARRLGSDFDSQSARTSASPTGKLQLTPSPPSKSKGKTVAKPPAALKLTDVTASDAAHPLGLGFDTQPPQTRGSRTGKLQLTSSSPSKAKVNSAAKPLTMLKSTDAAASDATRRLGIDFDTQSAQVFPRITATVKAAPKTFNPAQPSWQEKMLMYDPIVLEDFAAWLNERGVRWKVLARAQGPEGKKKRKTKVKSGAEAKGKKKAASAGAGEGNARSESAAGREKGKEEEDVEVVEVPLEAWVVQKWCESKSVCCLWKQGLRGGVRARY